MHFSPKMVVKSFPLFASLLVLLVILGVMYIANGDGIPVVPHDQLDIEVLCYKLAAEHPTHAFYTEFMGGQESSAAPVSCLIILLFYLLFPAATAFAANLVCVMIMAYVSMYASLRLLGVRDSLAAISSFLFGMLPFYSVYGLSSMGGGLVLCAVLLCSKESGRHFALAILLCVLYASYSSFVWAGFAVCAFLFSIALYYAIRRNWGLCKKVGALLVVLAAAYVLFYFDLFVSLLEQSGISHRSEYVLAAQQTDISATFDFFLSGHYHSVSNHRYLVFFDIGALIVGFVYSRQRTRKDTPELHKLTMWVCLGLCTAFGIALFRTLFLSEAVVAWRSMLPGSLGSFQFDRIYWLYPCVWYITSGLAFELMVRVGGIRKLAAFSWLLILFVTVVTLHTSAKDNVVVMNAEAMIMGKSSSQITWAQFYANDLFEDIKEDINEIDDNKRVISVGLHPGVALYNGLSTVDGYSVNYPVAYKHEFSKIIDDELNKSEVLHSYFWEWGNRCYAFSHELGKRYLFSKDSGILLRDFSMNVDAMREMGVGYIVSAVPISNHDKYGLGLVGQYCSDESYYELFLYHIT